MRRINLSVLLAVAALSVAAGWVRVAGLSDFALNPDESLIVNAGLERNGAQRASMISAEPHPPLRYAVVRAIGRVSREPIVLRGFAFVPGILLIPALFLLGRRAGGTATGMIAAFLGAFGHAAILLSGVVRAYSLAALCVTVALWQLLEWQEKRGRGQLIALSIAFAVGALASHATAIPLLAIFALALVRARRDRSSRRLVLALAAPLAILIATVSHTASRLWGSDLHHQLAEGWLRLNFPASLTGSFDLTLDLLSYLYFGDGGPVIGLVAIIGAVVAWRDRARPLAKIAAGSIGLALALAVAGIYPYGGIRHMFVLFPLITVLVALVPAAIWERFWSRRPGRVRLRAAIGLATTLLVTSATTVVVADRGFLRSRGSRAHIEYPVRSVDVGDVLSALSARIDPGDVVLVNGQTREYLAAAGEADRVNGSDEITFRGSPIHATSRFFFDPGDQLDQTLIETGSLIRDRDTRLVWLVNIGWGSFDQVFPIRGRHRALLVDGAVRPGAFAVALPAEALRSAAEPALHYRVRIGESGVYRVRHEDLAGAQIDAIGIASEAIGLTSAGAAVPIWVADGGDGTFDPGDWIEFVGRSPSEAGIDEFSDHNVYRLDLVTEGPTRMAHAALDDCDGVGDRSQRRRLSLARQQHRTRLPPRMDGPEEGLWYWSRLSPLEEPFEIALPLLDLDPAAPATLRVHLRGWSHRQGGAVDGVPDHRVELTLDDRDLTMAEWSNRPGGFVFEVSIEGLQPLDGGNRLQLRVPQRTAGDPPQPVVDVVLLDRVEVDYGRRPKVPREQIRLEASGAGCLAFEAGESTSLLLYDEGGRRARLDSRDGRLAGRWKGEGSVRVVPEGAWLAPAGFEIDRPSNLRSPDQRADYIVVAHRRLRFAMEPLAQFHRERGLEVKVVDVQDIYDEFNHGIEHPRAIRDFLVRAHTVWRPPAPRFVLLAGDASFDPRRGATVDGSEYEDSVFLPWHGQEQIRAGGYEYADRNRDNHRNLIPTWTHSSHVGQAASDHGFVNFGADGSPAMAIGRLPVTEPHEVAAILAKTIDYAENGREGDWRRRILWITNESEYLQRRTDDLAATLTEFDSIKVYPVPDEPNDEHRSLLKRSLNDGQLLVHFLGHGGRFIWRTGPPDFRKNHDLFTLDHLEQLSPSNKLPMILSMTCYSAPFDHPNADSIGEKFLRVPGKGAVAVIAASWRIGPTEEMSRLLLEEFTRPGTAGEALQRAKTRSNDEAFIRQFNLLGDPALPLAVPDNVAGR